MRVVFASLLFLCRELASFVLNATLVVALALVVYVRVLGRDSSSPQFQADFVASYIRFLSRSDKIQIGRVTTQYREGQPHRVLLEDVEANLARNVHAFVPLLILEFKDRLAILPNSVILQSPRFLVQVSDFSNPLLETEPQAQANSANTTAQKLLFSMLRFLIPLFSENNSVTLNHAHFLLATQRGTRHAVFEKITTTGHRAFRWDSHGELRLATSTLPLHIQGQIGAIRSDRQFKVIVEKVTPQAFAYVLDPDGNPPPPRTTSAQSETLRIDYKRSRHGFEHTRVRLTRRQASQTLLAVDLSRRRRIESTRLAFSRARVQLERLPTSYVDALRSLLPYSPPLDVQTRISARVLFNRIRGKTSIAGDLALSRGQVRWHGNDAAPMQLEKADWRIDGTLSDFSLKGQLHFEAEGVPFAVKTEIEVKGKADEWRARLAADSESALSTSAFPSFWPPKFKPQTRADVLNMVRGGRLEQPHLVLNATLDFERKPPLKLSNLVGTFHLQDGRLRVNSDHTIFEDIEAEANFTKRRIVFTLTHARHEDIVLSSGTAAFTRQDLGDLGFNTLFDLHVQGGGNAETGRTFLQNAPFLQESTALQDTLVLVPQTRTSLVEGNFQLNAYLKQLRGDETTPFPQELRYATRLRLHEIRFESSELSDYLGSGELTATSHGPQPLLVEGAWETPQGQRIEGKWRDKDRNSILTSRAYLEGTFSTAALARKYSFLPLLPADVPFRIDYEAHGEQRPRALLVGTLAEKSLQLEAEGYLEDFTFQGRLEEGEGEGEDEDKATLATISGALTPERRKAFLAMEGWGGNHAEITLDKNGDSPARVLLSGKKLNLSAWIARKPWRSLEFSSADSNSDARKDREGAALVLPDFNADIRFDRIQFLADQPESGLANILGDIRVRKGRIQKLAFNTRRAKPAEGKKASVAEEKPQMALLYAVEEEHELLSLRTNNLGHLLQNTHGSKAISKGSFTSVLRRPHQPQQRPKPAFEGYARARKMTLHEAPVALRLFDAVGIVTNFVKGVRGLDVRTDLELWDQVIKVKDFKMANPLTAITSQGSVDLGNRRIDLKGEIASLPLLSDALRYIPLIGYLLVGGKQNNLFAFSYEMQGNWADPELNVSPFTFFMPGVLKVINPLQLIERDDIAKEQRKKRRRIVEEEQRKQEDKKQVDKPRAQSAALPTSVQ